MTNNLDQEPRVAIHARCNRCRKLKPENELNGLNPFVDDVYQDAYCRSLTECDSPEAKSILDNVIHQLNSNQ
jgi:hypothetical protein